MHAPRSPQAVSAVPAAHWPPVPQQPPRQFWPLHWVEHCPHVCPVGMLQAYSKGQSSSEKQPHWPVGTHAYPVSALESAQSTQVPCRPQAGSPPPGTCVVPDTQLPPEQQVPLPHVPLPGAPHALVQPLGFPAQVGMSSGHAKQPPPPDAHAPLSVPETQRPFEQQPPLHRALDGEHERPHGPSWQAWPEGQSVGAEHTNASPGTASSPASRRPESWVPPSYAMA